MWDNAVLLRNIANALLALSVLAALYGAAYFAMHLPGLFPVRTVHLSAAPQRVDGKALLAVARKEVHGNLFTVDIERLRASLEKLPWVRGVSIRREFPHGLMVRLEEHHAIARWNGSLLVNQQGEIFAAESEQPLPNFTGQDGTSAEMVQRYAQFNRQLEVLGLSVAQIALSPRHAWRLRLSNDTVLELGREEMQQRLAQFIAVYPYAMAEEKTEARGHRTEGAVAYVDLRYRNGFAVRRLTNGQG